MAPLPNRGSRSAPIWVIAERPFESDAQRGYLFSGGLGNVFERMVRDAGLSMGDLYICARRPDLDRPADFAIHDGTLNAEAPPFIVTLGEASSAFLPELKDKDGTHSKGKMQSYAGSLMQCHALRYPHYMMPIYGPDRCVQDWSERNVTTFIDLQKLKDELLYWRKHGTHQPLPQRTLVYGDLDLQAVLDCFKRFEKQELLSVDIETIYPRGKSKYIPHPGYPITIGIADSPSYGVSFNLFREDPRENRVLWRALDALLRGRAILGQNFFNFDACFLESLGYTISLDKVRDTLIRHHILWPELSHKLQFLTRQYTREPYYKDEGKGWSIKNMDRLRRYNCLDVCVTYEVYLAQEEEFKQRKHLAA